jgi:hypothetical protein
MNRLRFQPDEVLAALRMATLKKPRTGYKGGNLKLAKKEQSDGSK